MDNKKFIYIRFIISLIFLLTMITIWLFKDNLYIKEINVSYLGSFMIAIYAFVYGVENVILKKYNLGFFLILFSIMIIILNIYMIRVVF